MTTIPAPVLGSTLMSTMSDRPLAISAILKHAVRAHAHKHIISRDGGEVVRFTYAEFGRRVGAAEDDERGGQRRALMRRMTREDEVGAGRQHFEAKPNQSAV